MITVAIPRSVNDADVWALFGDGLVSLLLDGDSKSRELARKHTGQRSADGSPQQGRRDFQNAPRSSAGAAVQDLPPIP